MSTKARNFDIIGMMADEFAGLCSDTRDMMGQPRIKMDMRLETVDKEIALGGDCYRDHGRDETERRKDDGMMRVLRAAGKL